MMVTPTVSIPIEKDAHGAYKVAGTRVTLDVLVAAYQQGDAPEQIHEGFPSLKLADIYAVITYYLNNQNEVDAYLRQRKVEAEQLHNELAASRPEMFELPESLKARLKKRD